MDVTTATPGELASGALVLMVERGEEVSNMLDAMHNEHAAHLEAVADDTDPLDPFGDHPEAAAQARAQQLGMPDVGSSLLESPMGVIPG